MRKTIKEWLSELPEPYRTQALENCDGPDGFAGSIYDALLLAFPWEGAPQGEEYWVELHKIYSDQEHTPDKLATARAEIAQLKTQVADLQSQIKTLTKPHVQMPGA